ncbi:MAG: prolyl oligopeptidase family serine peptidase [Anaerolineales bacterium]
MTGAVENVLLDSGGAKMLGTFYQPDDDAPRPAVVLLHALPGGEKNLDLAHELRRLGVGCLVLFFRGAWGSGGSYHVDHLVPDARVALDWLEAHPRADSARLGMIGWSLGGWAALAATAHENRVRATVAMAPLIDPATADIPAGLAEESAQVLHGTTPEAVTSGWRGLAPIGTFAAQLSGRKILLVTADADTIFPTAHYFPLLAGIPSIEWIRFPRADHVFLKVRSGMCHTISRWLLAALDAD